MYVHAVKTNIFKNFLYLCGFKNVVAKQIFGRHSGRTAQKSAQLFDFKQHFFSKLVKTRNRIFVKQGVLEYHIAS